MYNGNQEKQSLLAKSVTHVKCMSLHCHSLCTCFMLPGMRNKNVDFVTTFFEYLSDYGEN